MASPSRVAVSTRAKRRLILTALGLSVGAALFVSLGSLVVATDDLQQADVIFVLAGSRINRPLEAAELYRAGYAPRILMSAGGREWAEIDLERRGIHVTSEVESARNLLVTQFGVPPAAITILPEDVDNTAQEAEAVKAHVHANGWSKLIVVAGCASTRRAGYALRRALGRSVTIIVRCSPFEVFPVHRWWVKRWSFRATFYEAPKLVAYWLGLKG